MDIETQTRAIHADFEADIDRVSDMASLRFELMLKATLAAWAARFPRHTFKAWEGHGVMSIEVQPPVMGDTDLNYLESRHCRGAVAELAKATRVLVDAYCREYRVTLCFNPVKAGTEKESI